MQKKILWVTIFIFSFVLLMAFISKNAFDAKASFHTPDEIEFFKNHIPRTQSPIDSGEYFLSSSHCMGCHGFDSAGLANISEDGNSVNLFDHWQSTMMANSARDPFWRAKVSHEILINPAHAADLQDKCTDCHAPMGAYTAKFHGIPHFSLADLMTDTLGLDGVACESCHTIDSNVNNTYSGIIPYDTTHDVYGPFSDSIMVGPMQLYEGYTPMYASHMNQARVCGPCHTLITQSVDTNGNYTGGVFPEQATYHEYLNSRFPADNITCQTCHMPHEIDQIIIANGFQGLLPRYPFNQHVFVGGNSFMLKIIKDNKTTLGALAEDWKFDRTIASTNDLLQQSTINFSLQLDSLANDTGYFNVRLENKAGHKFPSGYPSRRAVVQFVITGSAGDTLFQSGTFANDWRVNGETPAFEPHHDVITQSNIPQIYEMVMGDVNYQFTSVLERAANLLKDDRIPPAGFTTTHYTYDTTKISNDALNDSDFNKTNSVEGTGVDIVHYHVPIASAWGNYSVHAKVFYQAVPPKWVDHLFTYSSAEIDTFRRMYNDADQTPVLMASDSIINITLGISQTGKPEAADVKVFPSLSSDGRIFISSSVNTFINEIEIYDSDGKKINTIQSRNQTSLSLILPPSPGTYILRIQAGKRTYYKKVARQ